jgi:hypothetical protein
LGQYCSFSTDHDISVSGKLKKYIPEDETYCLSIRESNSDPVDVLLRIDEFEPVSF